MLADALVTAGDPRGEFIQLQMAIDDGRGTKWMETRASQLLTEHLAAWSRPFGPDLDRHLIGYRGGFAYRVHAATPTSWSPEWATIEELELAGPSPRDPVALIARLPILRNLFAPTAVLERMVASGRVFPSVRTLGWLPPDRAAFPQLAVIAGHWHAFRDVARLEAVQRRAAELALDAIVHNCIAHVPEHIHHVVAARALGPAETRCMVLDADHVDYARQGWYVRTWKERRDAIVGFRGGAWFETHTMRQVVEPLVAAGITRIALAIPQAQRLRAAQLIDELRAAGVEIGEAPPSDVLAPATVAG